MCRMNARWRIWGVYSVRTSRSVCALLLLTFLAGTSCRKAPSRAELGFDPQLGVGLKPEEVVDRFCAWELSGKIGNKEFREHMPLFTWPDAGWDTAFAVRGYKITGTKIDGDKAEVTVEYDVLGMWDSRPHFEPQPSRDIIPYRLVRTAQQHYWLGEELRETTVSPRWKIDWPQMPPHISAKALGIKE
jgi:hypothetical protein